MNPLPAGPQVPELSGLSGAPGLPTVPGAPGAPGTDDPAVVAVIVTYQGSAGGLQRLLQALVDQVDAVVLVDNGSSGWRAPDSPLPMQVIRLDSNVGLAAAQNRGLQAAQALRASFVLLLDQDSVPECDMVPALLAAYHSARHQGHQVAAVGPLVLDEHRASDGFVRFRHGRYVAVPPPDDGGWISCDMLIASGSLIPSAALRAVGPMAESLFIDKVDTEWCLRAGSAGFELIGAPRARLHHRLGEHRVRLWFGQWRHLPQHKPFRYYYMVRNSLLLRRLPHAHSAWRRADTRQLCSIGLYFGLLAPGRWGSLCMMVRGLRDGFRGVAGPLR
jgi:rhamnosyltransferase